MYTDVVPVVIEVATINSLSFTINWTSLDPSYNYTVIWTNLHTGVMYNRTVPGNTNSYTVTGLSGDVNYNVSVATVNMCGMMSSDPVTVFGEYTVMCHTLGYIQVFIIVSDYIAITEVI